MIYILYIYAYVSHKMEFHMNQHIRINGQIHSFKDEIHDTFASVPLLKYTFRLAVCSMQVP